MLTNVDEGGKTFEDQLPVKKNKEGEEIRAKSIKLKPTKIKQVTEEETIEITDFEIKTFDAKKHNSLLAYFNDELKPLIANLDYKDADLKVTTAKTSYYFDADKETIIEETKDSKTALGCGKIVIKASYKKATKTKEAYILITNELTPDYEKDYEIIPHAPNEEDNQQNIANFMAKYITKPFRYIENTIGVEINFNKVFYKPEELRTLKEITTNLKDLEDDLLNLEKELAI
jgi:type I restriction enzyme M protein